MRSRTLAVAAAAWLVAALAAAAEAPQTQHSDKLEAKPAPVPAAKPAPPAPAKPVTPAVPAAPVVKGLDPKDAKGTTKLNLELPKAVRLGGFAFVATFDPLAFALAEPEQGEAIQGYLCQANITVPGVLRHSCVGIPKAAQSGAIASLVIHYKDRPPRPEDFKVTQNELVDELGTPLPGLQLAIVAPKP
jgi:hypothetical protein